MIRYLSHTEIDKEKWDTCIASSPDGLVYANSWYLDIVSPGWEALIEEDYTSVFPLTHRKKAGIRYLYQPYFTQQLGLFCKSENVRPDTLKLFISAIPEKFKLIEIQLGVSNTGDLTNDFTLTKKITHHLNLSDQYDTVKKKYSENLLRNIRKAQKAELKVSDAVDPKEIIGLFRLNRGSEISNLKSNDYQVLQSLLAAARERNLLECRGIMGESGKIIAGAAFIRSHHSYIFLFSATGEEARENGAMSAIIDSFICDHSSEKYYLDFEGSMDTNLSRYYKSFGSQEVVYLQIRKNSLPVFLRWLK